MKLRNKKTGEVGILNVGSNYNKILVLSDNNEETVLGSYESLNEFNEEWEDYEDPKEYWYIDPMACGVYSTKIKNYEDLYEFNKLIGNRFETEEEAEKAVEKLKAWKRLKDNGFSFHGYDDGYDHNFNSGHIEFYVEDSGEVLEDLDLLFGGEE